MYYVFTASFADNLLVRDGIDINGIDIKYGRIGTNVVKFATLDMVTPWSKGHNSFVNPSKRHAFTVDRCLVKGIKYNIN